MKKSRDKKTLVRHEKREAEVIRFPSKFLGLPREVIHSLERPATEDEPRKAA